MNKRRILLVLLVTLLLTGCADVTPTARPTPLGTEPFQPEPQQPLIQGMITGIPDNVLVSVSIKTSSGKEASRYTMPGSGGWQAVQTDASGLDYTVTAAAEGYTSMPIGYTIHLDGLTALLVVNGEVTQQEAVHLDFHFEPAP